MSNTELWDSVDKAIFYSGFNSYYDYLETIVNFLLAEKEKHNQSIDEINQKIESGEIEISDDAGQMPPELEYDYYRLSSISEFENTLFSSFFVTIYFYFESELIRHCRKLEKESREKLSFSDIAGNGILARAKTYLTKVQQIDFSFENSPEWERIQNYTRLRNCIVHNQGRLDEGFENGQRDKLSKFIQKPDSKLLTENSWCILNKEFCLEALDTIKIFLYSVTFAKQRVP